MEDKLSNEEISGLLGRMLFSGEERMKPTATLSGGETVRLLLAKLMLFKDNVLILDEPTNHLDLQSIAALSEGLQRYEGTVIVVTHDQELIREVGVPGLGDAPRASPSSTSPAPSTSSWRSIRTWRWSTRTPTGLKVISSRGLPLNRFKVLGGAARRRSKMFLRTPL